MARCIVVGGGLAGLSSCIYLFKLGYDVELIEASPKLGGRTYSFQDRVLNSEIDNGQHIFMGSYQHTFELLKVLGVDKLPDYQSNLNSVFLKRGGEKVVLKFDTQIYPYNLIKAFLNYSALSKWEKLYVMKLFSSIIIGNKNKLEHQTAAEWLRKNNQSENTIKSLWEIIGVSALNTRLEDASAEIFQSLIKKIFLNGNRSSTIVLPNTSLNKLFIEPSLDYFNRNRIKYSLSERLIFLESVGNEIKKIVTNKREIEKFDKLILALPHYAFSKIKSNRSILSPDLIEMETSPIITVHLRTDRMITQEKFLGLIDSKIQWIFNNGNHFSLVISAADDLIESDNTEIISIVKKEIHDYFPSLYPLQLNLSKVIKEKRATLKVNQLNEKLRKYIGSDYINLKFAGDWTDTGLPCTIEGAILSGKLAAEEK